MLELLRIQIWKLNKYFWDSLENLGDSTPPLPPPPPLFLEMIHMPKHVTNDFSSQAYVVGDIGSGKGDIHHIHTPVRT